MKNLYRYYEQAETKSSKSIRKPIYDLEYVNKYKFDIEKDSFFKNINIPIAWTKDKNFIVYLSVGGFIPSKDGRLYKTRDDFIKNKIGKRITVSNWGYSITYIDKDSSKTLREGNSKNSQKLLKSKLTKDQRKNLSMIISEVLKQLVFKYKPDFIFRYVDKDKIKLNRYKKMDEFLINNGYTKSEEFTDYNITWTYIKTKFVKDYVLLKLDDLIINLNKQNNK